jgi:hypothetical protein
MALNSASVELSDTSVYDGNTGTFPWVIPAELRLGATYTVPTPSDSCMVRVFDPYSENREDYSDDFFVIKDSASAVVFGLRSCPPSCRLDRLDMPRAERAIEAYGLDGRLIWQGRGADALAALTRGPRRPLCIRTDDRAHRTFRVIPVER